MRDPLLGSVTAGTAAACPGGLLNMAAARFDVVVAGGGPAGGTAAYELSRRGIQVLLLEKDRLPRYKVCAGGLTLKVLRLLNLDLGPVLEQQITKAKCTFRCGSSLTLDFGEVVAWTVMRDQLDHLILQRAAKAGARVEDQQRVRDIHLSPQGCVVNTQADSYPCSVVIGADGANGIVARRSGLVEQRQLAIAVQTELAVPQGYLDSLSGCIHFDFGLVPGGYAWVFPKKRTLSVGLGTFSGRIRKLKPLLHRFVDAVGIPTDREEMRIQVHPVPLGGVRRDLHTGRVLVVGDAASLAHPTTGEGIFQAVKSAKIAADTVHEALLAGQLDLSSYTARINEEIAQDLERARRLSALLYRLPNLCLPFFLRAAILEWRIAWDLHGRSSFRKRYRELGI